MTWLVQVAPTHLFSLFLLNTYFRFFLFFPFLFLPFLFLPFLFHLCNFIVRAVSVAPSCKLWSSCGLRVGRRAWCSAAAGGVNRYSAVSLSCYCRAGGSSRVYPAAVTELGVFHSGGTQVLHVPLLDTLQPLSIVSWKERIGYLAAKSEADHYARELKREQEEIITVPDTEAVEVAEILAEYGIEPHEYGPMVNALRKKPQAWLDFMMN